MRPRRARNRPIAFAALALASIVALPSRLTAHDIPLDVTVNAFVKPEAGRLRVLVRVPLRSIRDIEFPTRGPGFLDMTRADPALRAAALQWLSDGMTFYERGAVLEDERLVAARVSLPSDRSFTSWETALAHVTAPVPSGGGDLHVDQAMLDVLFEYPVRSEHSGFSMRLGLARLGLRVVTVLRFLPASGELRAFEYVGDPGLVVLDPRWHQASLRFVRLGLAHIVSGFDHLLFLLCLVLPCRRLRQLVIVISAFTLAHSTTLIASAYNFAPRGLWFPPFVEALIAVSILYMALENLVPVLAGTGGAGHSSRRWAAAFAFGLVHGFGFSFALRENLQFAGQHLLASLVSFNVGVEVGQLLVVAAIVPVVRLTSRSPAAERVGTIVVSALVAHTAWHWTLERGEALRQFDSPAVDARMLAQALRWAMILLAGWALVWGFGLLREARRKQQAKASRAPLDEIGAP